MYKVYIIVNPEGKTYIGQTNNLERRLKEHNNPDYRGTLYTKRIKGPWKLLYFEGYSTRGEAMKREKELKSGKGRKWIKEVLLKGFDKGSIGC